MIINQPLKPKDPKGVLRVILLGRVSTLYQNEENIEASYREVKILLSSVWSGPVHIEQFGERASGMLTDRTTIVAASEEIATGTWDLVLMEDISRSYRNPRWIYAFIQDCVDAETRVIAPGDMLDTADENWEINLGAAALRHGLHIPDTRRRVRRTADYGFHNGGMVTKVRFGFRKLSKEEADSGKFGPKGLRIAKIPECTPILNQIKNKILSGDSLESVARWLNDMKIPTGQYAKKKWTGKLLADNIRDPILSGTRSFRKVLYRPVFKTGKHRREKNPKPEIKHIPELAHFSQEEHAELIAFLDARKPDNQRQGKENPRYKLSRSASIWPGQHATCAICNNLMYRTLKDQLKCQNALPSASCHCWNHVQFRAEQARQKILPWLIELVESDRESRDTLINTMWSEYERAIRNSQHSSELHMERIAELERRAKNLGDAIATGGELETLISQLKDVEQELTKARRHRDEEEQHRQEARQIHTREEVAERWRELIFEVARTSYEFAALMRRIIPVFEIQPVQALNTNQVHPRARVILQLSNLSEENPKSPEQEISGAVEVFFDLFDAPAHIQHLEACLEKKHQDPKKSLRTIAQELGIGYMTVKRCFAYERLMEQEGLDEPYRVLTSEPEQASRWKIRKKTNQDDTA